MVILKRKDNKDGIKTSHGKPRELSLCLPRSQEPAVLWGSLAEGEPEVVWTVLEPGWLKF